MEVYKETENDTLELTRHVPIDISSMIVRFLGPSEMNFVSVQVWQEKTLDLAIT